MESDRSSGPTIQSAKLSLQQARQANRPLDVFMALIRLAHLHFRQGHYDEAQVLVREVIRDSPPDSLPRCDALRILGNCAAELGDPAAAELYYHQAIDLARQLDYRYALYKCLHSLATNIYWPRGQFDLTLAAGKEALAQAQALHLGDELWFPLSDIAWVYWSTGRRDLAAEIAEQMERVVLPGSLGEGFTCCLRAGLVEPGPGFLTAVLPLYQCARSIAEATGDPGLNVEVRLGLCRSYRAAGNLAASAAWADDAAAVTFRLNYRQFQAVALIERARTAIAAADDPLSALNDLESAIALATELQAGFDLARGSLYRAALLFAQNHPQADAAWAQTVRLSQSNGYDFLLGQERSLVLPFIAAVLDSADPCLARTGKELYEQLLRVVPAPLRFEMLGDFSVWVGANSIPKQTLRQRRAGELLALLQTTQSHTLTRQEVTDALCPEKDSDAALDFYHHAVSALRHLLEPDLPDRRFACRYLDVDDERIKLVLPAGSTADWQEFAAAFRDKDWETAVTLCTGEFLPIFCTAEWTIPLRQDLADQFEFALLALADSRFQAHDPTACLDLCRRVLRHNPWQEQAVALGMRAAVALGDRITAVKLYQRLEKVLQKELGLAPQKEVQQLYATIRRQSLK
ncbi:MAG: hypothetical protein IPM39_09760 [Chloroflexi bacterium]|nr:hypothetical protein [Chloroflexota bacterium]